MFLLKKIMLGLVAIFFMVPAQSATAEDEALSLGAPPNMGNVRHGDGKAALETNNQGVLLSNGFYVGPKANAPERKAVSATEMMQKRGMLPGGGGAWYHPDTQGNSEGLSLGGLPENAVNHNRGTASLDYGPIGGISGANVMPANSNVKGYGKGVNISHINTDVYARDFDGTTNLHGNKNGVKFFSNSPGMRISIHQPVLSSAQMSGIKILSEGGEVVYQSQRSETNSAYFIFTETGKPGQIGDPGFIEKSPSASIQRAQATYVSDYPNVEGLGQSSLRPVILKTNTTYIFAPYALEWRENKPTDWFRSRMRIDNKGINPALIATSVTTEEADMGNLEPLTDSFKFFLKQPRNKELANRIARNPQLIDYMVKNQLSQSQVQSFASTIDEVMKQAQIKDISAR